MEKLAIRLGQRLRELRGEQSQRAFARKLGISKSTLNRMEMGEQNVTLDTLDVLCTRLKCDVAGLFSGQSSRGKTERTP